MQKHCFYCFPVPKPTHGQRINLSGSMEQRSKAEVEMASLQDHHDYLYKIILLGDSGVGKPHLLSIFTKKELDHKATIGIEFGTRSIQLDNKIVKAQVPTV